MNCMPVVSSQYWNQVHGNTPEEVKQDLEGMQTMRTLGNNMAWLLKCMEAGKAIVRKAIRELYEDRGHQPDSRRGTRCEDELLSGKTGAKRLG